MVPGYKEEEKKPEDPTLPPQLVNLVPKSAQDENRSGEATARSRYIPWNELLRRVFGSEVVCPDCGGTLRLISLVKTEATIRTLLAALHLSRVFHSPGPPKVAEAERPPEEERLEWSGEVGEADWVD